MGYFIFLSGYFKDRLTLTETNSCLRWTFYSFLLPRCAWSQNAHSRRNAECCPPRKRQKKKYGVEKCPGWLSCPYTCLPGHLIPCLLLHDHSNQAGHSILSMKSGAHSSIPLSDGRNMGPEPIQPLPLLKHSGADGSHTIVSLGTQPSHYQPVLLISYGVSYE